MLRVSEHYGRQSLQPVENLDTRMVRKILVVSCTAIGDTLFATPCIRAVRHLLPDAEIDLLVREKFLDLFMKNPWIDSISGYKGRYRGGLGLLWQMKTRGYDLCLIFHDSDPCPVQAAFLAGIPFIFRIGQRDEKVARWLSARIPYDQEKHAIDQRLEVVRKVFGMRLDDPEHMKMDLYADPGEGRRLWQAILNKAGLPVTGTRIIGMQFAASGSYKEWPPESFASLAHGLLQASKKHVICLTGSPGDRMKGEKIRRMVRDMAGSSRRVLNLAGKIKLSQFSSFIQGMDLLVSNDTGPLHVAIAVETPTVSLFVPSNARATGPVQDLAFHRVITKPKPCTPCVEKYCKSPDCMRLITVEEVMKTVMDSLSRIHGRHKVNKGGLS